MRQGQLAEKIAQPAMGLIVQARTLLKVSLFRNSICLILNSVLPAITGFFFWTIAARMYSTAEIGLASSAISIMTLLMLLSSLGLDIGLIRFISDSRSGGTKDLLNTCFTVAGTVALVVSAVFVIGLKIWAPSLGAMRHDIVLPIVFVMFTVAFAIYTLLHYTFIARRRTEFALTETLVFSLVRFGPLILLVGFLRGFGIFVAWGCSLIIAMFTGFFLLKRIQPEYHPYVRVNTKILRDMGHFSISNYSANLFWMAPGLILPLMVVNRLGAESGAYFYIGWAIANIILLIPPALSISLFAEGANNQTSLPNSVTCSLKMTILLVCPAVALCFPLGNMVLSLFGSGYSANATHLLWLLAIAALPASLNQVYFSIQRVRERMRYMVAINMFIALVTLILSYLLLPKMGIIAAGISYLFAQTIPAAVVSVWLINSKLIRESSELPISNQQTSE